MHVRQRLDGRPLVGHGAIDVTPRAPACHGLRPNRIAALAWVCLSRDPLDATLRVSVARPASAGESESGAWAPSRGVLDLEAQVLQSSASGFSRRSCASRPRFLEPSEGASCGMAAWRLSLRCLKSKTHCSDLLNHRPRIASQQVLRWNVSLHSGCPHQSLHLSLASGRSTWGPGRCASQGRRCLKKIGG